MAGALFLAGISSGGRSASAAEKPRSTARPRTVQQRTFAEDPNPAGRAPATAPGLATPSAPSGVVQPAPGVVNPAPGSYLPWPQAQPGGGVIGLPPQPQFFPGPGGGSPPNGGPYAPQLLPGVMTPGVLEPQPGLGLPGQAIPEYPPFMAPAGPLPPSLGSSGLLADSGYWIVSTRNCPDGGTDEIAAGCVRVLHRDPTGCLQNAELPQFHAALDPTRPIVFVIHGSYNYWRDVLNESQAMHAWLARSGASRPVQMVFFTWPSDGYAPFALPLEVAVLGRRSAAHSVFLAGLIRDLPPGAGLSMIGHSHGARTSLAAAHLLAGGRLENGQCLGPGPLAPRTMRAVLLAAAVDHQWLNPGERYGRALEALDRVLVFRNSRDFWLAVYPLRKPFGEPSLSGAGLSPWDRAALGPLAAKVIEFDVSRQLGAGHNLATFYRRGSLAQVAGRFAVFEDDLPVVVPGSGPAPYVVDPSGQPISPGYPVGTRAPTIPNNGLPGDLQSPAVTTTPPAEGGRYSTTRPITPPRNSRGNLSGDGTGAQDGFVPPRLVPPSGAIETPTVTPRNAQPVEKPGTGRSRPDSGFKEIPPREVESPAKILPQIEEEPASPRKLPTGLRGPNLVPPKR